MGVAVELLVVGWRLANEGMLSHPTRPIWAAGSLGKVNDGPPADGRT